MINRGSYIMFRWNACLLSLFSSLFIGCTGGHNDAIYEVTGQVLDAASSEPFEDARITVDLQRDGVSIEFLGRPTVVRRIAAGVFEADIKVSVQGGGFGFAPIPPPEFGPLPNEVQINVRFESGFGFAILSIDPEDIVEVDPNLRRIQLPTIKVVLSTETTGTE